MIIDQVQKLNALNIKASHLLAEDSNPDSSFSDSGSNTQRVYRDLNTANPTNKLIYVTPEKLNGSDKFGKIIASLYNKGLIARLVIDEAHCVNFLLF